MSDPVKPRWIAAMADSDGFVMDEDHIFLWATDVKKAEFYTAGPPTQLVIVTGSARPVPQSDAPDETIMRLPGSWYSIDKFLDMNLDDQDGNLLDLWNRAKAAVAGMNAAGVE